MASSSFLLLLILCSTAVFAASSVPEIRNELPIDKVALLRFFMHYNIQGPNPSAVRVVRGPPSLHSFGDITVVDMPLTAELSLNSPLMGRAQGFYVPVSQQEYAIMLNLNVVFTAGPYKGSSLSVTGRDITAQPVREIAVVGGTGDFRLARGFVLIKTCSFNQTTQAVILDVDAHVLRY